MDKNVKEAFLRVKEDVFTLGNEITDIRENLIRLKQELSNFSNILEKINSEVENQLNKSHKNNQAFISKLTELENSIKNQPIILENQQKPTDFPDFPTDRYSSPTHSETPTDKLLSQVLKRQNMQISTGNRGVPTDRQTNQQTDRHTKKSIVFPQDFHQKQQISQNLTQNQSKNSETINKEELRNNLDKVSEFLSNLDSLKKEIRHKFKALSKQELLVFSKIYELEDQGKQVDYKVLATTLRLSESSVRDYIGRIITKNIPIIKERLGNKKILITISPDLKKIASLNTIIQLREL